MKKFFLNSYWFLQLTGISFFFFYACSDQKLTPSQEATPAGPTTTSSGNNSNTSVASIFNKTVGAPIDGKVGRNWINNFSKANGNVAESYVIQSTVFNEIMTNTTCVGICLYYAKDSNNRLHILPLGIDANGKAIPAKSVAIQNGTIDWATALQWIDNYTGTVSAHFFGTNMFLSLTSAQNCTALRTTRALDNKGNPQLLLSNASDLTPATYADDSFPCPPICPTR